MTSFLLTLKWNIKKYIYFYKKSKINYELSKKNDVSEFFKDTLVKKNISKTKSCSLYVIYLKKRSIKLKGLNYKNFK